MDSNDYYKILGIMKKSSDKEIKNAYRRLARKYHPDRNSKVSDDIMKNINIAFEVLSDPEKRNQYDMTNFDDLVENNDEKNNNYKWAKNVKINSSNSSSSDYKTRYERESSSYIPILLVPKITLVITLTIIQISKYKIQQILII